MGKTVNNGQDFSYRYILLAFILAICIMVHSSIMPISEYEPSKLEVIPLDGIPDAFERLLKPNTDVKIIAEI